MKYLLIVLTFIQFTFSQSLDSISYGVYMSQDTGSTQTVFRVHTIDYFSNDDSVSYGGYPGDINNFDESLINYLGRYHWDLKGDTLTIYFAPTTELTWIIKDITPTGFSVRKLWEPDRWVKFTRQKELYIHYALDAKINYNDSSVVCEEGGKIFTSYWVKYYNPDLAPGTQTLTTVFTRTEVPSGTIDTLSLSFTHMAENEFLGGFDLESSDISCPTSFDKVTYRITAEDMFTAEFHIIPGEAPTAGCLNPNDVNYIKAVKLTTDQACTKPLDTIALHRGLLGINELQYIFEYTGEYIKIEIYDPNNKLYGTFFISEIGDRFEFIHPADPGLLVAISYVEKNYTFSNTSGVTFRDPYLALLGYEEIPIESLTSRISSGSIETTNQYNLKGQSFTGIQPNRYMKVYR